MTTEDFLDSPPPDHGYTHRLKHRALAFLDHFRSHSDESSDDDDPALMPHKQDSDNEIHRPAGLRYAAHSLIDSAIRMGPKSNLALAKVLEGAVLKDPVNDRKNLMEDMMEAVIKDGEHRVSDTMTQLFVKSLWEDLQHPPEGYLSRDYAYRTADGSRNSLLHPQIGAAGQSYARSVKPKAGQPAVLPDPEVIFETLLQRGEKPRMHPAELSSMLPYLATIIIHDIFKTDHEDPTISRTSSYLDLAPLYGSSDEDLARMRAFKDGKLKPDCFSETRLLALPPGSGILLILFNRFHNHVAEQLVSINEHGRFTKPQPKDKGDYQANLKKWENDVFQTARLITGGLYVNIILVDYVRTILNLNRTDSKWQLNPRVEIPDGPEPGVGNQVSAEFNLVYRWHGVVSPRDAEWTEAQFHAIFGKDPDGQYRDPSKVEMPEFLKTLGHMEVAAELTEPMERRFEKLERQADGYYRDDDLAKSLTESCEDLACAFGPKNVPSVLKAVEVLGMKQARAWNLATLNEFRKHFGLTKHQKFSDISSDPDVADALSRLYKHPDHVELAIGMAVEDAKPVRVPGSGLCPGYTAGRAILADAVSLVRGDRFYTTAYHPRVLTTWGFGEAGYDTDIDNGCVFYKLFQTGLPHQFHPDSIYTHCPLTGADANRKIYKNELARRAHLYDTVRPDSRHDRTPHIVRSHAFAQSLLHDSTSSKTDLSLALALLCPDQRSTRHFGDQVSALEKHLAAGPSSTLPSMPNSLLDTLCSRLETNLGKCLDKSYKLAKFLEIDVIQEVIIPCSVKLAAEVFGIPNRDGSRSICSAHQLSEIFRIVVATWTNFDSVKLTGLRQKVSSYVPTLRRSMLEELGRNKEAHGHGKRSSDPIHNYRADILDHLFECGLSEEQVFVASIIFAASLTTNLIRHSSEILDHLLNSCPPAHLNDLYQVAKDQSHHRDSTYSKYGLEILRLSSEAVSTRILTKDCPLPDGTTLKTGQHILLSARTINRDPSVFTKPAEIDLSREQALYLPFDLAFGTKDSIWQDLHLACLRSIMRIIIGSHPNLRPARIWDGKSKNATIKKVPVRFGRTAYERREIPVSEAEEEGLLAGLFKALGMHVPDRKSEQSPDQAPEVNGVNDKHVDIADGAKHSASEPKTNWGKDFIEGVMHSDAAKLVAMPHEEGHRVEWVRKEEEEVEEEEVVQMVYLDEKWESFTPFPCTLKVNWDPLTAEQEAAASSSAAAAAAPAAVATS